MASYKVVCLLSVLALVGCVPIGTKASDPVTVLKAKLKDSSISFEQKVAMLRRFPYKYEVITGLNDLPNKMLVIDLVNHCEVSPKKCRLSRFNGEEDVFPMHASPELNAISNYCTSLLKGFCRDHIDLLGNNIVRGMSKGARNLMASILDQYMSLERTYSESQRQENVLVAINEVFESKLYPRRGVERRVRQYRDPEARFQLHRVLKEYFDDAMSHSLYMYHLFKLISGKHRLTPGENSSILVTYWYYVGEIARIVHSMKNFDSEEFLRRPTANRLYHRLEPYLLG